VGATVAAGATDATAHKQERANMNLRFELKLIPELRASIDTWRRQQPELMNRADAARMLIAEGLKAAAQEATLSVA